MLMNTPEYLSIIENIKSEIKAAQYRATIHANSDLLLLYYDIGTVINEYKTWGNKFIENLSYDIQVTFPERKGYSVRNLKYMAKFAARFADREIVQEVLAQITWYHNIALMDKVKTGAGSIQQRNGRNGNSGRSFKPVKICKGCIYKIKRNIRRWGKRKCQPVFPYFRLC